MVPDGRVDFARTFPVHFRSVLHYYLPVTPMEELQQ